MKLKPVLLSIACLFRESPPPLNCYEAENAMIDSNLAQKTADASASGGYYVNMKGGNLAFSVTVASAGSNNCFCLIP